MKKFMSMIVVVVLVMSMMSVSALAMVSLGHTITITSETDGHTYQAYQVFAGDYSENGNGDKVLTNIVWGSGVNGVGLLAALKADGTYGSYFTNCSTAAQVADTVASITAAGFPDAFAKIVSGYLTSIHTDSGNPTGSYTYTIEHLNDGYYFVNEKSFGGTVDNAYTKYILQVLADVQVTAKTDSPAVAKKVLENNDAPYANSWNDAADYSIGNTVPFRVVGLVPNMNFYQTYFYQFTDTLSNGLSFNSSSVKVYYATGASMYAVETSTSTGAGGTLIPASNYTLATTATGFTVTFNNLKGVSGVANDGYIVVEYNATLDTDAVIANPGNPNEVYLTYSNNPNNSGLGNTDKGQTPKDEVVVYTFKLPVNKVTKINNVNTPLADATFALFTTEADALAAVEDPTALDNALGFNGTAGAYTLSTTGSIKELEGDANGEYSINGLDQGTYYLVEINEPVGYNRLLTPVTVVIAPTYNDGTVNSAYVNGHVPDATNDQLTAVAVNDADELTVVNQAGSILPGTGGIGTTIFTVVGILLMAVAAVVVITKKKMAAQKD